MQTKSLFWYANIMLRMDEKSFSADKYQSVYSGFYEQQWTIPDRLHLQHTADQHPDRWQVRNNLSQLKKE